MAEQRLEAEQEANKVMRDKLAAEAEAQRLRQQRIEAEQRADEVVRARQQLAAEAEAGIARQRHDARAGGMTRRQRWQMEWRALQSGWRILGMRLLVGLLLVCVLSGGVVGALLGAAAVDAVPPASSPPLAQAEPDRISSFLAGLFVGQESHRLDDMPVGLRLDGDFSTAAGRR